MLFYSTFITGLQHPITKLLNENDSRLTIIQMLDGAVLYEARDKNFISSIRYFNNTYEVLLKAQCENDKPLEFLMKKVLSDKNMALRFSRAKKKDTFRIVTSIENQLVSVDRELKINVELLISDCTGLVVNRENSTFEYWFLYRSEGYAFFLNRLTKHTAYDKLLKKGELHPELAYILNYISEPEKDDIVLDPFCGYGSIPIARTLFVDGSVFACDTDKAKVKEVEQRVLALRKSKVKISTLHADVENLDNHFKENSVDKIVTDPPWGMFDNLTISIDELYQIMLERFYKIIKSNGIIVILTAKKDELRTLIQNDSRFILQIEYNILVSGKKASVFKLTVKK